MKKIIFITATVLILLLCIGCAEASDTNANNALTPESSDTQGTTAENDTNQNEPVIKPGVVDECVEIDGVLWKNEEYVLSEDSTVKDYHGKRISATLAHFIDDIADEQTIALVLKKEKNYYTIPIDFLANIRRRGINADMRCDSTHVANVYIFPTVSQFKQLPADLVDSFWIDIAESSLYLSSEEITGSSEGISEIRSLGDWWEVKTYDDPSVLYATMEQKAMGTKYISSEIDSFYYPNTEAISKNGFWIGAEVAQVLELDLDKYSTMLLTVRNRDGSPVEDSEALAMLLGQSNDFGRFGSLSGDVYMELTKNELLLLKLDNSDQYLINLACRSRMLKQNECMLKDGVLWAPMRGYGIASFIPEPIDGEPDPPSNVYPADSYDILITLVNSDYLSSDDIMALKIRRTDGLPLSESDVKHFTDNNINAEYSNGTLWIFVTGDEFESIGKVPSDCVYCAKLADKAEYDSITAK